MTDNTIKFSVKMSSSSQKLDGSIKTEGTRDYEQLYNKPKLNGKVLSGNTELDLRLRDVKAHILTNSEIEQLLK